MGKARDVNPLNLEFYVVLTKKSIKKRKAVGEILDELSERVAQDDSKKRSYTGAYLDFAQYICENILPKR